MEPSRIHELNKIAGAFCGKKLTGQFSHGGERWVYASYEDECTMQYTQWNPSENHEQAAEVKAMLREKAIEHESRYDSLLNKYLIRMSKPKMAITVSTKITGYDESELIALLLAVEAVMKKEKHA